MNSAQELFFTHLDDSLAAFKVALRRAINIDDNRESHLDDAGAARDELGRAAGQLLFSLGCATVLNTNSPLASITVPPGTDVYGPSFYGTNLPGTTYFLRSTATDPVNQDRDMVRLDSINHLIPRL